MQYKTLDSLCKVASGGTPSRSKKEYWDGGDIPWIKIGNIKSKVVSNADEYITEAGLNNSSAKLFKKGTILYTIFATLGEVGILDFDACTNQAIAGISIEKPEEITTDYLYYYLKSKKAEVNQIGRGVAQNNINLSILRKFSIPLRDIEDQKTIVGSLHKVESIIEKQKRQLERLDELIKARFVEMFDAEKTVELQNLARSWMKGSGLKKDEMAASGSRECIHYGELFTKYGPYIEKVKSYTKIEPKRMSKYGDILFPATDVTPNGLTKCSAILKDGVILGGDIIVLRPIDEVDPIYLSYAIRNEKEELIKRVTGALIKHISSKSLMSVRVKLPTISKQKQFVDFVRQVDKSKFALSNELAMGYFYIGLIYDRIMHGRIDL